MEYSPAPEIVMSLVEQNPTILASWDVIAIFSDALLTGLKPKELAVSKRPVHVGPPPPPQAAMNAATIVNNIGLRMLIRARVVR
jgi:hypothetical protein